jgi:hypothetical protein
MGRFSGCSPHMPLAVGEYPAFSGLTPFPTMALAARSGKARLLRPRSYSLPHLWCLHRGKAFAFS